MAILSFDDAGVRRARQHDALKGKKMIGRGWFAAVYDNGDTVLKLTCDAKSYALHADFSAPQGPHFPKIVHNWFCIEETKSGLPIYLIEVEKLKPVNAAPPDQRKLANRLLREINRIIGEQMHSAGHASMSLVMSSMYASMEACNRLQKQRWIPDSIKEALEDLSTFASNYECNLDPQRANIMFRGDCLVFNDIVCDGQAIVNSQRERR